MKLIAVTVLPATTLAANTVRAEIIETRLEKAGDNTCFPAPPGTAIKSNGPSSLFTNRTQPGRRCLTGKVEVSGGTVAYYEFTGLHRPIAGKCKLLLTEGNARITRAEFALGMDRPGLKPAAALELTVAASDQSWTLIPCRRKSSSTFPI